MRSQDTSLSLVAGYFELCCIIPKEKSSDVVGEQKSGSEPGSAELGGSGGAGLQLGLVRNRSKMAEIW